MAKKHVKDFSEDDDLTEHQKQKLLDKERRKQREQKQSKRENKDDN